MAIRMVILISFVALCMGTGLTSCERLKPENKAGRQLKIERFESIPALAIPAEFGNLMGVSSDRSDWAQLWFEKPDKTIVVVWVNSTEGAIRDTFVLVPRK